MMVNGILLVVLCACYVLKIQAMKRSTSGMPGSEAEVDT